MKLGREGLGREGLSRKGREGREEFKNVFSRLALAGVFSFNRHFLRTRLFGIYYSTDLKRNGGLQAVYSSHGSK